MHKNRESVGVVLDVDETLVLSVKRHYEVLTTLGKSLGWKNLPTFEQVLQMGGTHHAYGHYPRYAEINAEICAAEWFNRGLEVIPAAREAMDAIGSQVFFYLTTRPASMTRLTYEELLQAGFPDRPVIARPSSVPLKKTAEWKFSVLADQAQKLRNPLELIDDSVTTHLEIVRRRDRSVGTQLYAGAITPPHPTAVNWQEIVQRLGFLR